MFNYWKKKYKIIFEENWDLDTTYSRDEYGKFKKKLIKIINWFYGKNIYIKKFPEVVFSVKSNLKVGYLNVKLDSVTEEKIKINFSTQDLISKFKENDFEDIIEICIKHELIHVEHVINHKTLKRALALTIRLERVSFKTLDFKLANLRILLSLILNRTYIEGIALFYQTQRKYEVKEFEKEYEKTLIWVETFVDCLNKVINEKNKFNDNTIKDLIENVYYNLGLTMIYSILIGEENISQNDLFKMSHIKVIKLYESSVIKINKKYSKNFRILFSYNSQKGILDYARYIKMISNK